MSEHKVGKVYSCGYGFFGQCGVGDTKSHKELVQVKVLENVVIMKCGDSFCVAVDKDNNVYTWGSNRFGQCAILPFGNYTTPVRIDTLSALKVSTIACGTSHCVLALTSGEVYSFGSGTEGRLGLGDDGPRYEPCKIEAFGSIKNIVGVSAGMLFSVAVSDKGKVYSWGANRYGQLGIPALKTHKSPQKVTSLDSMFIDKVACGRSHTLVVTDRGTVFGFGHNMCGQLGDKTTTDAHLPRMAGFPPGVKTSKLACGYYHSLCLTLDGSVYSWGYNAEGALGLGAVMGHQNVPHSLSHTLKNILLPGETVTEIKAAGWHSALVTSEKRVLTFGLGDTHRLGHGNDEDLRFPKVVDGISVKDVECAGANTFFITG